jgi:predicted 3-demethylubiquinone-9 3-methyltransferase (glyoxalase superfamily)
MTCTISRLTTCLWFDGQAEEAAESYVAIFRAAGREAAIRPMLRVGEAGPDPSGRPLVVPFTLDGQELMGLNGGPQYRFTPAASLAVPCADQAELDHFWHRLLEGGQPDRCGWLTDRFGLSWQVFPRALTEMMSDADTAAAGRAMQAMMGMVKLDLAALRQAFGEATPAKA